MEEGTEPKQMEVVKELLGARDAMLVIRCNMRKMGEAAGIPVCYFHYVEACFLVLYLSIFCVYMQVIELNNYADKVFPLFPLDSKVYHYNYDSNSKF